MTIGAEPRSQPAAASVTKVAELRVVASPVAGPQVKVWAWVAVAARARARRMRVRYMEVLFGEKGKLFRRGNRSIARGRWSRGGGIGGGFEEDGPLARMNGARFGSLLGGAGTRGEALRGVVVERAGVLGPRDLDDLGDVAGEVVADVGLAGRRLGRGVGLEVRDELGEGSAVEGRLVEGGGVGLLLRPDGGDAGEVGGHEDGVVGEGRSGGIDRSQGEGGAVAVDRGDGGGDFERNAGN